jgi:hypothetical protein
MARERNTSGRKDSDTKAGDRKDLERFESEGGVSRTDEPQAKGSRPGQDDIDTRGKPRSGDSVPADRAAEIDENNENNLRAEHLMRDAFED